jgi:hypothetical protein
MQWHIVGVGDFLGNGQSDLVWENASTGQHAIWLLDNGVLSSTINLPAVPIQWHIAGVGDFAGNRNADLVWENTSTGQRAIWLLKNGVPTSSSSLLASPLKAGSKGSPGEDFVSRRARISFALRQQFCLGRVPRPVVAMLSELLPR